MVYLKNPPPPEAVKAELDWDIHKDTERLRRRRKKTRLYYLVSDSIKKLRAFVRGFGPRKEIRYAIRYAAGPRILDVGCGEGNILAQLPARFIPYGIEPSPGMHKKADAAFRARGGYCIHNVAHLGMRQIANETSFDLIIMRSFLEHDAMAAETLSACHDQLAANGKVLIKVPNFECWNSRLRGSDWPGIRNPDHVNYFSPSSLASLLRKTGFSKVYIPLLWRMPTSDNLWVLAYR